MHKWVLTTFLYDFPHGTALRVWDSYLLNGLISNLKFILAFVKQQKDKLVEMDLYSFAPYLKTYFDGISEISNRSEASTKNGIGTRIDP